MRDLCYWISVNLVSMHLLQKAALTARLTVRTLVAGLLMSCLPLFLVISFAEADFDKIQTLAQQRYGSHATDIVASWRKLIEDNRSASDADKINRVNAFFNRRVLFESDSVVWQQEDYWATPLEFMGRGAGDCEDFSVAKYITLQLMGISNQKLRLVYVRAAVGSGSVAHMVLSFYAQPTDEPLILDNLISSVRPASQRTDLAPVFSFNSDGLWVGGATTSAADPTARLSRWRDLLERMRRDGF